MSSLVYFKFKANVKTDSVPFDGSSISVKDLKNAIRTKCGLHSMDFDLKLEDTTGKAYTKDDELIPKYTSIVVRRVPRIASESQKKRIAGPDEITWRESQKNSIGGDSQQSAKHVNLADSDLPEEEKIKIMMERSSEVYSEKNFTVKAKPYGIPPVAYVCHKCNQPGHWIHNCPGVRDKTGKMMDVKSVKRPTGIPVDFLLEVEAGTPGAYLGKSGRYMVPIKDAEAYAQGKKDKRPFSVEENPPYVPQERKPPKGYICPLCDKLFTDAVLVSCCGTTYCNDCIMGHVFDSQVLGSHKCPNCNAVLTDHESSVFENALVRSMIRDWLANESELPQPESQDDVPKLGDLDKTFVNNRRVLKPRQAVMNQAAPMKQEQATTISTQPQQDNKLENPDPEPVPPVKNELSNSPSVSHVETSHSNDSVTISSTPSVLPLEPVSVSEVTSTTNSLSVKTINTSASVVASAPCTTLVEANKQSLLAVTGGLSNTQLPCISYASSAVIPTVLPSINGGGNPLFNALYNMRVDTLPASLVAPTTILPTAFQGPIVGGPDWTTGTSLTASAAQSTGLVDPVLQVNSNQVATFGLVPGQVIPGSLQTSIPAPIPEALDGHRMLSREEFYRLKMEALQYDRRRRHRSRSRSPGYSLRRSSRPHSKSSRRDHYERENWERRVHHYSSKDYDKDYFRYRHRLPEEVYESHRDRIPVIPSRHRSAYIDEPHNESDRYRSRERIYKREHRSKPSELSPMKEEWMRYNYQPSPRSRSPQEVRKVVYTNREPHVTESALEIGIRRSRSRTPVSVVPQYDSSDTESDGRIKLQKRRSRSPQKTDQIKPRISCLNPSSSPELGVHSRNPCSLKRPMSSDNLISDSRMIINLGLDEQNVKGLVETASDTILPLKKKKKDKKTKKHKHKHSTKRKLTELLQDLDQDEHLWVPSEIPMDGELNDLAGSKPVKKHKKHKKHKHGKEKKKKPESENPEETANFVFIHDTNDLDQV